MVDGKEKMKVRVTQIKSNAGEVDELYTTFFKCSKCRDERILSDFKFCGKCGRKIEWLDPVWVPEKQKYIYEIRKSK